MISKLHSVFAQSKYVRWIVYSGLFFLAFSFAFAVPTDPDFWWHLRYGEIIVKTYTIPLVDTFTYTLDGTSVVDTEWLVEAIFYLLYTHATFIAVSFVFALATSASFLIPILFRPVSLETLMIGMWAIVGSSTILIPGPRPQLVSILFFSFLLTVLLNFIKNRSVRILFFIPPLFLLWANTHPGYMIGIVLLFVFTGCEFLYLFRRIIQKHTVFPDRYHLTRVILLVLLLFLSYGATMLKPSGSHTFAILSPEAISSLVLPMNLVSGTPAGRVRMTIQEWLPPILSDIPGTLFLLALFSTGILFTNRTLTLYDFRNVLLLLVFAYFSTLSRRNVPYFFLIFLAVGPAYMKDLISSLTKMRTIKRAIIILFVTVIGFRVYTVGQLLLEFYQRGSLLENYCDVVHMPCKAVEFIKKTKPEGRMLNYYTWGGYLIWNVPEYKVFVDGRIPGGGIYEEFDKIVHLESSWQEILDKHHVGWILFPRYTRFEGLLLKGGWKQTYVDSLSVILVRDASESANLK